MANKDIFIKTVKENEALVYKVASFYTDSKDDRDDLVQEIIYQLWKSFDSFNNKSALTTWMYRVALNTAIVFLKKSKRRVPIEPVREECLEFPDIEDTETEERFKLMQDHIKALNLMEKGIIMLYLEGKSYEEIAVVIGISASNVGTRISRIKDKLKQQIAKRL
ncbi:RNA polymerase sigma factor [Pedobacter sp. PWIIR3]